MTIFILHTSLQYLHHVWGNRIALKGLKLLQIWDSNSGLPMSRVGFSAHSTVTHCALLEHNLHGGLGTLPLCLRRLTVSECCCLSFPHQWMETRSLCVQQFS